MNHARRITVTLALLLAGVMSSLAPATAAPTTWLLEPGDRGPMVRELQHRLYQRDLFGARTTGRYDAATEHGIRIFQRNRGLRVTGKVNKPTLDTLERLTWEPSDQEKFNQYPGMGALDSRCRTGHVLCVDKGARKLRWVVDGQVRMVVDARFGATATPTREGRFAVQRKSRDHVSNLYESSMPFAMFFSGGQAVHYSSDFAARGYAGASHGCVNIRDRVRIAWLFDHVEVGDKVIVSWG